MKWGKTVREALQRCFVFACLQDVAVSKNLGFWVHRSSTLFIRFHLTVSHFPILKSVWKGGNFSIHLDVTAATEQYFNDLTSDFFFWRGKKKMMRQVSSTSWLICGITCKLHGSCGNFLLDCANNFSSPPHNYGSAEHYSNERKDMWSLGTALERNDQRTQKQSKINDQNIFYS